MCFVICSFSIDVDILLAIFLNTLKLITSPESPAGTVLGKILVVKSFLFCL